MSPDFDTELAIDITSYIKTAKTSVGSKQYTTTDVAFDHGDTPHDDLLTITFTDGAESPNDTQTQRHIKYTLSRILEDTFDWFDYHNPYPEIIHGTVSDDQLRLVFKDDTPVEKNRIEPLPGTDTLLQSDSNNSP